MKGSPKSDMGASGRVSSLIGPGLVFMGDAAHCVQPYMGQGCNCGMQDALLFAQVGQDKDCCLCHSLVHPIVYCVNGVLH